MVTLTEEVLLSSFSDEDSASQTFSYSLTWSASDWSLNPGLGDSNQEASYHGHLWGRPEDTVKSKSSLRVIKEILSYDNMAFVLICFDKSYSF